MWKVIRQILIGLLLILNNEKNEIKIIIKKPIRRKNTNRKIINYKKSKYNIDNSYYTINLESEEKNKKREE